MSDSCACCVSVSVKSDMTRCVNCGATWMQISTKRLWENWFRKTYWLYCDNCFKLIAGPFSCWDHAWVEKIRRIWQDH